MSASGELGGVLVAVVWLVLLAGLALAATLVGRLWRRARGAAPEREVSEPATVVSRREGERSGYWATFALPGGRQQEFLIWGEEYERLDDGASGTLTHRGDSYLRFDPDGRVAS